MKLKFVDAWLYLMENIAMRLALEVFSQSYVQARAKFLGAAEAAGLDVTSYPLALPGRDGEALAVDTAWQGPRHAARVLLLTSGVHGVEGYAGSGAQIALLQDSVWMEQVAASGIAALYVHALNPHGFSHIRRVTQENVDLNRNFQDFSSPLPSNPAYCKLQPLLLPATWPPTWGVRAAILGLIATQGLRALQTAFSGGQYEEPGGMFFGGTEPTWSHRTLRQVLREHMAQVRQLAWIDLHTGLGKSGQCERIFMGAGDDVTGYTRANAWWGKDGPLAQAGSASSVSASLTGLVWNAALGECPHAELTGVCLEFGTKPLLEVANALRGDHWLHLHPETPPVLQASIRQHLFEAFFVDTPEWKRNVVAEVHLAAAQALDGLGN